MGHPFGGFGRGFGEGLEGLERSGALGLAEDRRHRVDAGEAVNLMANHLQDGQRGELRHAGAVAFGEVEHGFFAGGALDAGLSPGEDERAGEALEVPLKGTADGLVEVIDVEEQAAADGAGVGAEVFDVGVAAELGEQPGVGVGGEIGSHDGHGSAEEAEG